MKKLPKKYYILFTVLLCALVMTWVDGVLQPGYAVKSAIKVILFLAAPLGYFGCYPEERTGLKALLQPGKKAVFIALGLGIGVYAFLIGGYFLLLNWIDIPALALEMTAAAGVSAQNFLWVSIYISFVNSFLEEILFRGFAFITLKNTASRGFAYGFSAVAFALYHSGMFLVSGDIGIWLLAMAGLSVAGVVLDFLSEKSSSIIVSWLVHMFANFGINTLAFMIFGMI